MVRFLINASWRLVEMGRSVSGITVGVFLTYKSPGVRRADDVVADRGRQKSGFLRNTHPERALSDACS